MSQQLTAPKKSKPQKSVQAEPDAAEWWICTVAKKPMGVFRHATLASAYAEAMSLSRWLHKTVLIFQCEPGDKIEKIGKVNFHYPEFAKSTPKPSTSL